MKTTITLDTLHDLSDDNKLQIGATYQQMFWESNGLLPTIEQVLEKLQGIYPEDQVRDYVASEQFQTKLKMLGMKVESPVLGLLSPEQIMVANMEMSLLDRRSIRLKLDEFNKAMKKLDPDFRNITITQYEGWRKDPAYQEYISKRSKLQYESLETEAYNQLAKMIANGDQGAMKLLFELKGRLNKTLNINMNVEGTLVRVVEIITRHVKDPQILEAISTDIEALELDA